MSDASSAILTVTAVYSEVPRGVAGLHEEAGLLALRMKAELHETGEYEVRLTRKAEAIGDDALTLALSEMTDTLPGGPAERTASWRLWEQPPF